MDANHVVADAGERILRMIPINTGCGLDLKAKTATVTETGDLVIEWENQTEDMPSTYQAKSLRCFADAVVRRGPRLTSARPRVLKVVGFQILDSASVSTVVRFQPASCTPTPWHSP